jgi:hypothetical protein
MKPTDRPAGAVWRRGAAGIGLVFVTVVADRRTESGCGWVTLPRGWN